MPLLAVLEHWHEWGLCPAIRPEPGDTGEAILCALDAGHNGEHSTSAMGDDFEQWSGALAFEPRARAALDTIRRIAATFAADTVPGEYSEGRALGLALRMIGGSAASGLDLADEAASERGLVLADETCP